MLIKAPKRLLPGDKVAIVATASPFDSDEIVFGSDLLREMGLEPVMGPNVKSLKSMNIHAAPVEDRVQELHWAFSDPEIKCVIAAGGGCGSAALLPHLDYSLISSSRKPFVGMSDNTAINAGLQSHAGLISINGQSPNIRLDKGKKITDADAESFKLTIEMLMSGRVWGREPLKINKFLPRTIVSGRARGQIVGGNLETWCSLLGTPFLPNLAGAILFIEDVHKNGEILARMFIHMKLAGVFDQVAGIVVGEFAEFDKMTDYREPAIEDVLVTYLSDLDVPVTYGYSFSHGDYTIPIPIGADCVIDADSGDVYFNFKMT